jgi:hypothetical protein
LILHVRRALKIAAKFVISMIGVTVLFTLIWQGFVANTLYACTDSFGFDYWQPGDWVHHPISVHQVITKRSTSEPDTIKEGWSMTRLWILWGAFVVISLAISVWFTLERRHPSGRTGPEL